MHVFHYIKDANILFINNYIVKKIIPLQSDILLSVTKLVKASSL